MKSVFLVIFFVAAVRAGSQCVSNNDCPPTECCQILKENMIMSKRDLNDGQFQKVGTCEVYTREGERCVTHDRYNGYCSCEPGTHCARARLFTPSTAPPTDTTTTPSPTDTTTGSPDTTTGPHHVVTTTYHTDTTTYHSDTTTGYHNPDTTTGPRPTDTTTGSHHTDTTTYHSDTTTGPRQPAISRQARTVGPPPEGYAKDFTCVRY